MVLVRFVRRLLVVGVVVVLVLGGVLVVPLKANADYEGFLDVRGVSAVRANPCDRANPGLPYGNISMGVGGALSVSGVDEVEARNTLSGCMRWLGEHLSYVETHAWNAFENARKAVEHAHHGRNHAYGAENEARAAKDHAQRGRDHAWGAYEQAREAREHAHKGRNHAYGAEIEAREAKKNSAQADTKAGQILKDLAKHSTAFKRIDDAVSHVFRSVSTMFPQVFDNKSLLDKVINFVSPLERRFDSSDQKLDKAVEDLAKFRKHTDAVNKAFQDSYDRIETAVDGIRSSVDRIDFSAVGSSGDGGGKIKGFIESLDGFFRSIYKEKCYNNPTISIGAKYDPDCPPRTGEFREFFDSLKDNFNKNSDIAKDKLQGLNNKLNDMLDHAKQTAKNRVNDIKQGIKESFERITGGFTQLREIAQRQLDTYSRNSNEALDRLNRIISGLKGLQGAGGSSGSGGVDGSGAGGLGDSLGSSGFRDSALNGQIGKWRSSFQCLSSSLSGFGASCGGGPEFSVAGVPVRPFEYCSTVRGWDYIKSFLGVFAILAACLSALRSIFAAFGFNPGFKVEV